MKGVSILLVAIVLLPVLIFAFETGGNVFTANNATAIGERYFTAITDMVGWFDRLGGLGSRLYNFVFENDEPFQPNEDTSFYSANEQLLMLNWEVENKSMTKFERWKISMKYFFNIKVDTDKWNAAYNWSPSNPYLKYKT